LSAIGNRTVALMPPALAQDNAAALAEPQRSAIS